MLLESFAHSGISPESCGLIASLLRELAWYLEKHPEDPLGHYFFAQIFWKSEPQELLTHLTQAAVKHSRR